MSAMVCSDLWHMAGDAFVSIRCRLEMMGVSFHSGTTGTVRGFRPMALQAQDICQASIRSALLLRAVHVVATEAPGLMPRVLHDDIWVKSLPCIRFLCTRCRRQKCVNEPVARRACALPVSSSHSSSFRPPEAYRGQSHQYLPLMGFVKG